MEILASCLGSSVRPVALISAFHSFTSTRDALLIVAGYNRSVCVGVTPLSPVISFRSCCNTLQGEMGVIQGNSGPQESRTFMVSLNSGDCVWPHSKAGLLLAGEGI